MRLHGDARAWVLIPCKLGCAAWIVWVNVMSDFSSHYWNNHCCVVFGGEHSLHISFCFLAQQCLESRPQFLYSHKNYMATLWHSGHKWGSRQISAPSCSLCSFIGSIAGDPCSACNQTRCSTRGSSLTKMICCHIGGSRSQSLKLHTSAFFLRNILLTWKTLSCVGWNQGIGETSPIGFLVIQSRWMPWYVRIVPIVVLHHGSLWSKDWSIRDWYSVAYLWVFLRPFHSIWFFLDASVDRATAVSPLVCSGVYF